MKKIPRKIVRKIEKRNRLEKQIHRFVEEEIGDDVYWDTQGADIVNAEEISGKEQGDDNCREWCDQTMWGEDCGSGSYFWETKVKGKFLRMFYGF